MKRVFILALVAFFAMLLSSDWGGLRDVTVAQEKKPAAAPEKAQERKGQGDKASPQLITGKVTQADEKSKTVTVLGKDGERVTLNFSTAKVGTCKLGRKLSVPTTFPKVGDNVVARAIFCTDQGCDGC